MIITYWKKVLMSFLTCTPDLSKTVFTDDDLRLARQHLVSIITREDAAWLKKPQGLLGEYWKSDEIYPICALIDTANMIYTLDAKVAQKSVPRLYEKVRELLRPPSPEQFLEKQNELQV